MSAPQVCVVVSAYDRSHLLPSLVAALQAQTVADFEAVLVDNGSADDTMGVLEGLVGTDSRFHILRIDENRGPARARNLGWQRTFAPWVAFTDDDCAPRPDWLAALLIAGQRAELVQGRTIPAQQPSSARPGWFDRSQRIERWSGRYETCNLLVARDVLERHGGFNEQFRIAMGEDTDLGLRATAAGAVTVFDRDAVVEHHVFPSTFRAYLRQRRRYSELVELMRVNPAARGLLTGGIVLRGVHVLVWALVPLAVVSVAIGVPWMPLVAVAVWTALNTYRTRWRPFRVPHRVVYSLLHLVAYAYETVCFAAASVRYRALVI